MSRRYYLQKLRQCFLTIIVPVLMLGGAFFIFSSISVREQIDQRTQSTAELGRETLELVLNVSPDRSALFNDSAFFSLVLNKILMTQSLTYWERNYQGIIFSMLNAIPNTYNYVDSVYLYVENGTDNYLRSGYRIANLKDQVHTEWLSIYQRMPKSKTFWMERYDARYYAFEAMHPVLSMFYRLPSVQGVMVVNLNPDKLGRKLQTLKLFASDKIIVADWEGKLLFTSGDVPTQVWSEALSQRNMPRAELEGYDGIFRMRLGGDAYILNETISEALNIRILTATPEREVYQGLRQTVLFLALAIAVAFGISLIAAYLLTRRSAMSLVQLMHTLSEAEQNRLTQETSTRLHDEYDVILDNMLRVFIRNHYMQSQLDRLELEKKVAELSALQLQINPHFLFNSLQTIDMEIRRLSGEADDAHALTQNLSEILKYALGSADSTVTLGDEIRASKKYVEIQAHRYLRRFSTIFEYDEEDLHHSFLRLLLQPLLENSIHHGLLPKEGKGIMKLKIERYRERLYVSVIDNGIGIDSARLARLRQEIVSVTPAEQRHIGLRNTNRRLTLTFGVASALRITSKVGVGTVIAFSIPIQRAPQDKPIGPTETP